MNSPSDFSDSEILDDQDNNKELDFDVQHCGDEIDSEDSLELSDRHDQEDDKQSDAQDQTEKREETEFAGPVLPGGHRFDKKFICIKYPGNVINSDKAIATLGGTSAITTAIETPNRRLELRFRPDDGYCKPACGDRHNTTAFLLRVRVKKSRAEKMQNATEKLAVNTSNNVQNTQDKSMSNLVEQIEHCSVASEDDFTQNKSYSENTENYNARMEINDRKNIEPTFSRTKYEDLSREDDYELPKLKVLGRIDTEFRFTNLCDFQYLPMMQSKKNPKELECIYNAVYPTKIESYSWLKQEVPYFLPPAAFSRMDSIQQYVPKTQTDSLAENVIGKSKKRRLGFTNFTCFSAPEIPCKPPAGIETAMKVKFLQVAHLEQMRKLFEERPIWSKNAIMYKTGFNLDQLKILLPSVAYYFVTGPWRVMWVRLGYDPRKDTSARKYQTLDYRLKSMHGLSSTVKCKRNYSEYTLPYKCAPVSKQKTAVLAPHSSQEQTQKKKRHLNENVYIYREGMVPPSRQMFYQYCDVLVDEVEEMLAKLPDPLPDAQCHEKWGWLPSGFDVQCREIINKHVRLVLRKQMNIPEDHPTTLPRRHRRMIGYRMNKPKKRRQRRQVTDGEVVSEKSNRQKNQSDSSEDKD